MESKILAYINAAEQGDAIAQCQLGDMYRDGNGVTQDYVEAVKWYTKSAEQGNADAQNRVGCRYYNGNGVTQDYVEAAKWFVKAAEQGNQKRKAI
ncbi:tetratricopeptide repeat protein [Chryseobacterium sp.]|uniref:tetratricopeptide repeat protein n=1 Tax=Chryseobacterium sp. TaxID=1871047 RepID=UPI002FCBC347